MVVLVQSLYVCKEKIETSAKSNTALKLHLRSVSKLNSLPENKVCVFIPIKMKFTVVQVENKISCYIILQGVTIL